MFLQHVAKVKKFTFNKEIYNYIKIYKIYKK